MATVSADAGDGKRVTARRQDLLAAVGKFVAVEAGLLRTLGLERRAKPVEPVWERIRREKEAERARTIDVEAMPRAASGAGEALRAQDGPKVDPAASCAPGASQALTRPGEDYTHSVKEER